MVRLLLRSTATLKAIELWKVGLMLRMICSLFNGANHVLLAPIAAEILLSRGSEQKIAAHSGKKLLKIHKIVMAKANIYKQPKSPFPLQKTLTRLH